MHSAKVSYEVLISERGLKEGDVLDWDSETRCITLFAPTEPNILCWDGGDHKKLLDLCENKSDFFMIASMVAQTHGMRVEQYNEHIGAKRGHIAFIFKKSKN